MDAGINSQGTFRKIAIRTKPSPTLITSSGHRYVQTDQVPETLAKKSMTPVVKVGIPGMNKPLKPGILEKMNGVRQNKDPAPTTKIGQARKPSRVPPPTARMSRLPARASTPNRIRVTPNRREVFFCI